MLLFELPVRVVKKMGMVPISSLEEGLELIGKKYGQIPPAYVMPYGGTTFPLQAKTADFRSAIPPYA